MITEDEATRLLKRADPARVDDSAPFVDAAGYLAALRTRSTTVTLIDTEPTPNPTQSTVIAGRSSPSPRRRSWPSSSAASCSPPATTTRTNPDPRRHHRRRRRPDASAAEAEEIARGFLDAYVANDADRALTYLTDELPSHRDRGGRRRSSEGRSPGTRRRGSR